MTLLQRMRHLPKVPLGVLALTLTFAVGGQLAAILDGSRMSLQPGGPPSQTDSAGSLSEVRAPALDGGSDLERIQGDLAFWTAKLAANPRSATAASILAELHVEEARATGDVTAYLRADTAADRALALLPNDRRALAVKGVILIALHRFADGRAIAREILEGDPNDPIALGVLGDAALELGDIAAARAAYERLSIVADSAPAQIRRSHLAFLGGDTTEAVRYARLAIESAVDDGLSGSTEAFYHGQLGELLAAYGDHAGARSAFETALASYPRSILAGAGLARMAAAEGNLDAAIEHLNAAILVIPQPELLARRGDLLTLRAGPGDAERARQDYATVEVIAKLAGAAASVYDRTLSLYLANHDLDPARALALAEAELAVRKDVYGFDAYAWALLANNRVADAAEAMQRALALGTRDPKLFYHAGMIAAAAGDGDRARELLTEALTLDPSFDPLQVARARTTLAGLP